MKTLAWKLDRAFCFIAKRGGFAESSSTLSAFLQLFARSGFHPKLDRRPWESTRIKSQEDH